MDGSGQKGEVLVRDSDDRERFDRLLRFLRSQTGDPRLAYRGEPTRLSGGFDTDTFRFELQPASADLNGPKVLRLYRGPGGAPSAEWEGHLQNALADAGVPVARVPIVGLDVSILGAAFLVMEMLPGRMLMETVGAERRLRILGEAHARLHRIDPTPVVQTLRARRVGASRYALSTQLEKTIQMGQELPWAAPALAWIAANRPPDSDAPAICHRDFHALNVLVEGDAVTGIVDWGSCVIADPAFDVANTWMLLAIPGRYLSGEPRAMELTDDPVEVDPIRAVAPYVKSYLEHAALDLQDLRYYLAVRCLTALLRGHLGAAIYRHPPILSELAAAFEKISGIGVSASRL